MKRHPDVDAAARGHQSELAGTMLLEREPDAGGTTATAPARKPATPARRAEATQWVVVLAGGEGRRLSAFTTLRDGVVVPKQFCRFRDERTLLAATLDRAQRITSIGRIVVVVVEAHRAWWEPELRHLPASNVLSQPVGRGTAVAILHALVHIHMRDLSPRIVVMPSDHDFEDENALLHSITRATRTAEMYPDELVLLGIAPSHLDSEYGLIVPGSGAPGAGCKVRAFIEKPTLTTAAQLAREGAMWNSFILASTGAALYSAFESTLPSLTRGYLQGLAVDGGPAVLEAMFEGLPEYDFSRDVLQRNASRLRLIAVPACGWTDLGTPARLAAWLDRHREAPFWREHRLPRLSGTDGLANALQAGGA